MKRKISPGRTPRHHSTISNRAEPQPTRTGSCLSITFTSLPAPLTGPVRSSSSFAIACVPFFVLRNSFSHGRRRFRRATTSILAVSLSVLTWREIEHAGRPCVLRALGGEDNASRGGAVFSDSIYRAHRICALQTTKKTTNNTGSIPKGRTRGNTSQTASAKSSGPPGTST